MRTTPEKFWKTLAKLKGTFVKGTKTGRIRDVSGYCPVCAVARELVGVRTSSSCVERLDATNAADTIGLGERLTQEIVDAADFSERAITKRGLGTPSLTARKRLFRVLGIEGTP